MDHREDFCRSFIVTTQSGETRRTRIYGSTFLDGKGGWDNYIATLRGAGCRITDIVVSYGEVPTVEEVLREKLDDDTDPRGA